MHNSKIMVRIESVTTAIVEYSKSSGILKQVK